MKYGSFILNVTNDCNFRCIYCPVNYKTKSITFEKACQIIDFCCTLEKKPFISFFGGEPLLVFDTILKPLIIKYYPNVLFGISTNGSLLTPNILQFLYEHKVKILFSIDGPAYIQNKQRPFKNNNDSFSKVSQYLPIISEFFPNTIFRSTCTPLFPEGIFESYLMAQQYNFKFYYNCVEEFSDNDWTSNKKNIIKQNLINIQNDYIQKLNNNEMPLIFLPMIEIINQYINPNFKINNNFCERCGLGTLSLGFDLQGNIFTCNEHASYSKNNIFCIGNIETGINQNSLNLLHQKFHNINCKNCTHWTHCRQVCCISRREFMFKNFNQSSKIWCFWLNTLCIITENIIEAVGLDKIQIFIKKVEQLNE